MSSVLFFFNDTATTEIYTLSLHDALPISPGDLDGVLMPSYSLRMTVPTVIPKTDRKSTRLNSSHLVISYAVFCLKKKRRGIWQGADCCPPARVRCLALLEDVHPDTLAPAT